MLVLPEILGHRERRMAHSETGPGGLVHLAERHDHVRKDTGFFHIVVKFLPFAATFAYAAKHAHSLVMPDHVVDHLGEQHGFAHARPSKQTRFAAAFQRHQHIDDLDARLEDLGLGGTPCQRRRVPMNAAPVDPGRRRLAVNGIAEDIKHAPENSLADGRLQRPARVFYRAAAGEALGGGQRNPAHAMRVKLGRDLDGNSALLSRTQQRINGRQLIIEPHIHDTAAHRNDYS